MSRSERLHSEGLTDTMYYGTIQLLPREIILKSLTAYVGSDDEYSVDIYEDQATGGFVACLQ
jgi:hypothetical protein